MVRELQALVRAKPTQAVRKLDAILVRVKTSVYSHLMEELDNGVARNSKG